MPIQIPPTYTRDALPPAEEWTGHRKTKPTRMVRMEGRFRVVTREGLVECEDGYLALDAHGYPYPVHVAEYDAVYVPVEPEDDDARQ